jgi:hypothetical protein
VLARCTEEESKDPLVKAMKRLDLEDDKRTAFVEALVGQLGDNKTLMSFVIDLIKEVCCYEKNVSWFHFFCNRYEDVVKHFFQLEILTHYQYLREVQQ